MIVTVRGALEAAGQGFAVVDVGGVGLRALIPASTAAHLPEVGKSVRLFTFLHVQESALTLYGFGTAAELQLFEQLLGVRGLGPAKALALLSGSAVDTLRADIAGENTAALLRIPGIGRRLAAQIVLDLKDKIGPVLAAGTTGGGDGEVLAWLTAMGFSAAEAQAAVARLPAAAGANGAVEERVRQALLILRPE
ncbi:MAG TPA: Holliday junction branch migration protein RuvA [Chloroflexota bacterium]|jgi:Holliday junction DNA helicase RuvA|nr:Holliday junction branch migration protein RuvA [Chloroflexota bacterium]